MADRAPEWTQSHAFAAMYPNNDTLGKRLRLYVDEHFHDA